MTNTELNQFGFRSMVIKQGKRAYISIPEAYREDYEPGSIVYVTPLGRKREKKSSEYNGFTDARKKECRVLFGEICFLCEERLGLAIHHVDYDKQNSDVLNLVPICGSICHPKTNHNRDYWKNFFQKKIKQKIGSLLQEGTEEQKKLIRESQNKTV